MKLTISTLLASIALLSPQALAMGEDSALDLQYAVRDAEALYGVATANGDLRFMNQGPSAAKLRWFDPLRGEEEVRVLHPGQSLVSQGQFGVSISEGTVVLVEKIGPGPIASGIASIPTDPLFRGCLPTDPCTTLASQQGEANQMHDSIHCLDNNGAFLPWHRGYFAPVGTLTNGECLQRRYDGSAPTWLTHTTVGTVTSGQCQGACYLYPEADADLVDTLVGGTMCSIESYRDILGVLSTSSTEYKFLLGDGSVRFLGVPPESELEHGPGMHDSVHCLVGGTMCSVSASTEDFHVTCEDLALLMIQKLELESGHTLPIAISLESFIVPTEGAGFIIPDDILFSLCMEADAFMPSAQLNEISEIWWPEISTGLEHGPGMHDSVHCIVVMPTHITDTERGYIVIAFPGETQNQCQGACYLYPEADQDSVHESKGPLMIWTYKAGTS